ncbi:MAG TPA: hypothetical protein ENK44_01970 [Caldithrix abyssi]|uniref:Uncharacterized protein n=1 Tax=Caldithrix abyssi TaxID=187145 RepID=A0A7V4TZD7_CALAY|nr:hypothetical protein [Caldithrix abyssi]
MNLHKNFIRIEITPPMREIAVYHARRRSEKIKRRFVPENAPLSALESNFVGALGEVAVRYLFSGQKELKDDYDLGKTDSGDVRINGKMYDIKSEGVPLSLYIKLYEGRIKPYEPYGCRVWTAKHLAHLPKYDGGVIFTALPIMQTEQQKQDELLRKDILEGMDHLIILGYALPEEIRAKKPQRYSPPHPVSGKRYPYYSPNMVFHHSELHPVHSLINR